MKMDVYKPNNAMVVEAQCTPDHETCDPYSSMSGHDTCCPGSHCWYAGKVCAPFPKVGGELLMVEKPEEEVAEDCWQKDCGPGTARCEMRDGIPVCIYPSANSMIV